MKTKPQFSALLKELRGDPYDGGVSRARLAEAAGLHEKAVVKLERGGPHGPTLRTLKALARALAVTRGIRSAEEYFRILTDADLPPE